ncbi:MAG: S8 family serine peptidase, partial [Polyangiaceae bacterium]
MDAPPIEKQRFLLFEDGSAAGRPGEALAELLTALRGAPGVDIRQIAGPEGSPRRLVVEADERVLTGMLRAFGGRVLAEPNRDLLPLAPGIRLGAQEPTDSPLNQARDPMNPTNDRSDRKRLLIGSRQISPAGFGPLSATELTSHVNSVLQIPGARYIRTIAPRGPRRLAALGAMGIDPGSQGTHVVEVDLQTAHLLKAQAASMGSLLVEDDAELGYGYPASPARSLGLAGIVPGSLALRFLVVDDSGAPVSRATVQLLADGLPATGVTGSDGRVTIQMLSLTGGALQYVQVTPEGGCWDLFVQSPMLHASKENVLQLSSLSKTVDGFPARFRYGWGQKLMGLDKLPDTLSGRGVRIAIIDSGADRSHPNLGHVSRGQDFSGSGAGGGGGDWGTDSIGHGTHCAGIIAAAGREGLRGFAPEAEIHVLKVFPGGSFSNLLDALDYCIEQEIDVVNLSLGSPDGSTIVENALAECRAHGVVCVVAAGNSGGAVQFPARSPNVHAVAALGMMDSVFPTSWDATQYSPQLATDGLFSPLFTCFGAEVATCAPGVGIISTYPGKTYKPESGTSMAAPHVTGMSALLLAHHPSFRSGPAQGRGPARVSTLLSLLRASAQDVRLGEGRTGAGLPRLHTLAQDLRPVAPMSGSA